ncbi:hypothetical protein ACFQZS_15825 [Mucilaginibacter calamicampi]|uniref:Uncharacterized protein n=1 Tax=Mucilaginibacter calamicampi TaxID=1302352 RepID=A0ABW2Z0L9_9SPHI
MESKNRLTEPTRVIIPVETAIERTTHWRNFMKEKTAASDVRKIPKAVYISKTDIIDMAKQCEADESIAGVRAYFTLNNEFSETIKNEVKFVMVLVRVSESKAFGDDVLYASSDNGNGAPGGEPSNVYDFTKPCPDVCDPDSPLYGG